VEKEDTQTLVLPVFRKAPAVTQNELSDTLLRDTLSKLHTSFSSSNANRRNNVTLCSNAINGQVLMPGAVFSFNDVVGIRTPERGYLEAGAYVSGKLVESIGGGICQVSSTLYNAALQANLKITSRRNHSITVGYLPVGLDATVNWGTIDLAFENNTDYPIQIQMWVENTTTLYAAIIGTKTDSTKVVMETEVLENIPYGITENINPLMAPGAKPRTVTSGHNQMKVDTYRVIQDSNGKELSRTLESHNTYRMMNRVVEIPPPTEDAPSTPIQIIEDEDPEDEILP
jgi:vancomycin resistance protein YoaR